MILCCDTYQGHSKPDTPQALFQESTVISFHLAYFTNVQLMCIYKDISMYEYVEPRLDICHTLRRSWMIFPGGVIEMLSVVSRIGCRHKQQLVMRSSSPGCSRPYYAESVPPPHLMLTNTAAPTSAVNRCFHFFPIHNLFSRLLLLEKIISSNDKIFYMECFLKPNDLF